MDKLVFLVWPEIGARSRAVDGPERKSVDFASRITVTRLTVEETAVSPPIKPAHDKWGNGRGRSA
ncbi:MAG: hypothetical protein IPH82_08570 [Chloroflexi bacterium]|nr:hypothetical protein [Chloroflexota bacterium]